MHNILGVLRRNWFLLGIVAALTLGLFLPEIGSALNRGAYFRTGLIIALFLISGLKLPTESIKTGMRDVRLHLFIQLFIFAVTPLFFFLTSLPFKNAMGGNLVIGIYALACLPTTISSCIVFTQASEGNVVGTMFNAALANIAGVIVSPLLLALLLQSTNVSLPVSELLRILRNLGLKMLLPIAIGQVGRHFVKSFVDKNKKPLSTLSNLFILTILFLSFAETAADPEFASQAREMPLPLVYLAVSHLVLLALAYLGTRLLGLGRENTVSVMFTAPQKTLAMGVPLLGTYFAARPEILGVALLPVLFYHPWQLLVAGFLPRLLKGMRKRRE